MWAQIFKVASMTKGALVVGVAASAAMVSSAAEFSNTPSRNEVPSATPSAKVSETKAPPASSRPANSPSTFVVPKASEVPAVQLPVATTPAAPSTTTSGSGATSSLVVQACLEKAAAVREHGGDSAPTAEREDMKAACRAAIEETGLSTSEFAIKYFGAKPGSPNASPKTEHKTAGIEAAIKECLNDWRAFAEQTSVACARALATSGLPAEEFWKKFEDWAVQQPADGQTAPSTDVDGLVKECFAKYQAKDPTTMDTCKKAMAASGLNGDAFWDKYGRPFKPSTENKPTTAPKSEPAKTPEQGTKPVTNTGEVSQLIARCLELYAKVKTTGDTKTVSEACGAAIRASGLNVQDFWTKYHPTAN